jgi:dipeptidyl aminopeptidase/acylaminoacyl peptidase
MDLRCAVSQAEELFGALRLLGREVELVRFPGESHDLSRSGRPDRRLERLRRVTRWFGTHLLGHTEPTEPVPASSRER